MKVMFGVCINRKEKSMPFYILLFAVCDVQEKTLGQSCAAGHKWCF